MRDADTIAALLLSRRLPSDKLPPITAGIYAMFLNESASLPMLKLRNDRLLYVGMTDDNRGARNHFEYVNSGFSSPRRSLGALLKKQLKLTVFPRSHGRSPTNWSNYRFSDEGETALTRWMAANLCANHIALAADGVEIERIETQLIATLVPPLNIKGVPRTENRSLLERLRRLCREEARKRASAAP